MDPVSAFGLAAGILQVLDFSFKAISTCREIYQESSLAEHRNTQETTEHLQETTEHLGKSIHSLSPSASKESKDVIDVSKKCSETAMELLSELKKLQLDPKGGLRQAIGKSVRAIRRKRFLQETQEKLERYQNVLNTRLLSKLDANALKQNDHFGELDQSVKDLAVALSQGHNTVAQLLANQAVTIQNHVDRRLNDKANQEAARRARQEFKDSLFFPEVFAREEGISRSHEGTCQWIFGSPMSEAVNQPRLDNVDSQYEAIEGPRAQPWSSFHDWIVKDSYEPYWLSGKPGSGKSTLMRYVSTEFRNYCLSHETLSLWSSESDLVTCSFYFWSIGSPLQKNYVGLLRSLLYQVAEQREDSIQLMRGRCQNAREKKPESHDPTPIHAWTEQRLEDALRRFLEGKPQTVRVCMFIDGLDEFVGDEDRLIDTIRLLSRSSGTKVCVSSRPEQIYRQGFATSPQLKLQNLNYFDIQKATSERLGPVLKHYFQNPESENGFLVEQVVEKSQGIFLWAELMTKDLKRGVYNADSPEELKKRLERTPDTIEGLYKHMLDQVDKAYLHEAARYFHHLIAHQDIKSWPYLPLTLLHFACSEKDAWSHVLSRNFAFFTSPGFREICRRLETRILTRCAGLVDIVEHKSMRYETVKYVGENDLDEHRVKSEDDESLSHYYLREVTFIHKTAIDFVKDREEFFEDSDWLLAGTLAATRGRIAVAGLTPHIISQRRSDRGPIILDFYFIRQMMKAFWPSDGCCKAMRDAALQIVDEEKACLAT